MNTKSLLRKIIFLLFIFSSIAFSAYAQPSAANPVKRDTIVSIDDEKYLVKTNLFWDNWFMQVLAGTEVYFGDHNRQMKLKERIAPAFSLSVGKWFSPGIGGRLVGHYAKVRGATQNGSYSTGVVYDASQRLEYQKFSYYQFRGDVLFNLSNMLGGYKEGRVYSLVPFVGLGYAGVIDKPRRNEVSATGGFLNQFKISKGLDLTLEIQGTLLNDDFDGEVGGRKKEGVLGASLGLAYRFSKRGWDKPQTTLIRETYDDQLLVKLRAQVDALSKDNEALKSQLANAKTKTVTDLVVENKLLAAPLLVTFPINSSELSNEGRVNLGFLAKVINSGPVEVVYKIAGYADRTTGNNHINTQLSKKRAEAVYQTLVKEFGVSEKQLRIDYKGGVANMYYDDPRLSRAVLTIAD